MNIHCKYKENLSGLCTTAVESKLIMTENTTVLLTHDLGYITLHTVTAQLERRRSIKFWDF